MPSDGPVAGTRGLDGVPRRHARRFRDGPFRRLVPTDSSGRRPLRCNGHPNGKRPPPVLVVEAEPATNHLFCLLLEREGYTCHGVEEGRQALSKASEIRPSAMLLDLMLPDMSGFDVYEKMRQSGPLRR